MLEEPIDSNDGVKATRKMLDLSVSSIRSRIKPPTRAASPVRMSPYFNIGNFFN